KLAKDQAKVANEGKNAAEQKAEPAAGKNLAQKQDDLTPAAKEVRQLLEPTAPKAADKVAEGAKDMAAAKEDFAKNELKPAAKEAESAAEKLKQAQQEVAAALKDMQ